MIKKVEIPVDLSAVVAEISEILRKLIGLNIELQLNLEREGLWVNMGAEQIEKVVVNLISNARDAMPQGGTITVETSRINVGPDFVRPKVGESESLYRAELLTMPEGNYARLGVRDTGVGMAEATRAMIFMPFFTTKGVGKGTGLGLSAVYCIVKQSGGWLSAESDLGRGTSIEVYLREVAAPVCH